MIGWRFLRSRRWAGFLALAVVFAIVCCALGTWQLNRRAEALTELARIDGNYDAEPVPVAEAMPDPAVFDEDDKWLPVELVGEYLPEEEVVVRGRPYGGTVGYEVLTPFRTEDGLVFAVDRGWVPDGTAGSYPPPPEGEVVVSARLKADEGTVGGRTSTGSVFGTVDLGELAERTGEPFYTAAYGLLVGPPTEEPPLPAARPIRDEGPHLSYALQWFVFAIMGFVGLGWAARQEKRGLEEAMAQADGARDDDPDAATTPRPASTALPERDRYGRRTKTPPKRASARPSDADIEDEILDRR